MAFKDLEILADPQGEAFIKRTSLYERYLEPFCRIMDEQIRNKTVLGTNEIFCDYARIVRWPIRKLEYSFVLHHALSLMGAGQHPRILEAGCGATPVPHLFAMMGAEVDAVDFNEDMIERLRMARVNELYGFPVHHQWMDLRRLAFPDSTFDLVTCVSVIERLGNGDEALALAEMMRVLKPGGQAVLTTDVKGGDDVTDSYKDHRRDDEPFSWQNLHSLLAPYAQMIEGGVDQIKIIAGLQDDAIERFWASHQGPTSTWQGNRGYVALGIVLTKSQVDLSTTYSPAVGSDTEGPVNLMDPCSRRSHADTSDVLLKSQIRKTIEFQHALEEKEKVIQELHAEAERRREALEAVSADRDAWEARCRQLTAAYDAVSQAPHLQSHIQPISELERTLQEKEKVIQDLYAEAERRREALEEIDHTLRRERAEWAKERGA